MAAHKAKRLKLTCGGAGVTRTSSTEPSPGMSKGRLLKKRVLEMETRICKFLLPFRKGDSEKVVESTWAGDIIDGVAQLVAS